MFFTEYLKELVNDARELIAGDRVKLVKFFPISPYDTRLMSRIAYGDVQEVSGGKATVKLDLDGVQAFEWPKEAMTIDLLTEVPDYEDEGPEYHLTRLTDRRTVNVQMLAFGEPDQLRPVYIRKELFTGNVEKDLELVFKYGQNDFQPHTCPSVSVGDVVNWIDNDSYRYFIVASFGFREMPEEELVEYKKVPQRERSFYEMRRTA